MWACTYCGHLKQIIVKSLKHTSPSRVFVLSRFISRYLSLWTMWRSNNMCFPSGLSAHCRGLAEDPNGQISGHQPPRRHEDLVEICQSLWQERTPGEYSDMFVQGKGFYRWILVTQHSEQNQSWFWSVFPGGKRKVISNKVKCNYELLKWNDISFEMFLAGTDESRTAAHLQSALFRNLIVHIFSIKFVQFSVPDLNVFIIDGRWLAIFSTSALIIFKCTQKIAENSNNSLLH